MILAPPDIEAAVVELLSARMDAATKIPNPRPPKHVRVTSAGGTGRNLIQDEPRLLIESWAAADAEAFDQSRLAHGLLWAAQHSFLAPGVWVSGVNLTVPANFPDPDTRMPRYQFVAQLIVSKTEVA